MGARSEVRLKLDQFGPGCQGVSLVMVHGKDKPASGAFSGHQELHSDKMSRVKEEELVSLEQRNSRLDLTMSA
ncbi:hypothetical protein H8959_021198 [Pygathrix nigripes]